MIWMIERDSFVIPDTGIEILPGDKIPFLLMAPNSENTAYWSLENARIDAEKLCAELNKMDFLHVDKGQEMFQAWKWENGYLYSQTIPRGEWRKCSADQTVEYLTECMREAAKIAFNVNAKQAELNDNTPVVYHTENNYAARDQILAMIGGE